MMIGPSGPHSCDSGDSERGMLHPGPILMVTHVEVDPPNYNACSFWPVSPPLITWGLLYQVNWCPYGWAGCSNGGRGWLIDK